MLTAKQVADYFLTLVDEEAGDSLSNLKLQKLVYYAQGFHLALTGGPLFADEIQAWQHGPVVPTLYRSFRQHGLRAAIGVGGFTELFLDGMRQGRARPFADGLFELSRSSWSALRHMPWRGQGWEVWSRDAIRGDAIPPKITADVNLIAFRFFGKAPMVGYRSKDGVLYTHG